MRTLGGVLNLGKIRQTYSLVFYSFSNAYTARAKSAGNEKKSALRNKCGHLVMF